MDSSEPHNSPESTGHPSYQNLREFPLFRDFSPERLAQVAPILSLEICPKGELIFRYAEPGRKMYFVCRGNIDLSLTDNVGHTETFGTVSPGDWVGEVAVITRGKRTADGRVTEELTALVLHSEDLDQFFIVCPEAQRMMLDRLAQRLEATSDRDRRYLHRLADSLEQRHTPADKRMAQVVQYLGSMWFLGFQILGSIIWMILNRGEKSFDPFPYSFLQMVLAVEGLIVALLILRYQNREEVDARTRAGALYRATDAIYRRLDDVIARLPPPD